MWVDRGSQNKHHLEVMHRIFCPTVVTRRKLQRPGTAKEGRNTKKQRTSTVNPNDRRPAPLTDHAPDSTANSTHDSSRIILQLSLCLLHDFALVCTCRKNFEHE